MHRASNYGRAARLAVAALLVVSAGASSAFAQQRVDVLIGFHTPAGPSERGLVRAFGGDVKHSFTVINAVSASIPGNAITALRNNPNVSVVELDGWVRKVDHSTELNNTWGVNKILAGDVHHAGNVGGAVKVAIVDSGVRTTHVELSGAYKGGESFVAGDSSPLDQHGHGTHVAGTVAAARNGTGVVGAAPGAHIYSVRVLDASGGGSWSWIAAAIEWTATNGMRVTNNSYGGSQDPGTLVRQVFDNTTAAGVLHIAAAGNEGRSNGRGDTVGYPAKYSSVMAVAATTQSNARASFSSTGPAVEIAAPGSSIVSTSNNGDYAYESMSGTSMASPHVAGVAALVIAANPDLSNAEVRSILKASATNLGSPEWFGSGLVNAAAAVAAAVGGGGDTGGGGGDTGGGGGDTGGDAGTFGVSAITYSGSGGPQGNKHLTISAAVVNADGAPVAGASIAIRILRNDVQYGTASGTTGSNGTIAWTISNAASGTYKSEVTSLSAPGLTWDGTTPVNSFSK